LHKGSVPSQGLGDRRIADVAARSYGFYQPVAVNASDRHTQVGYLLIAVTGSGIWGLAASLALGNGPKSRAAKRSA
jgi:hypothetical protein